MLTAAQLAERRVQITGSADLTGLLLRLTERAAPLLVRAPHIPQHKAMLSSDGGICPDDGAPLIFDPWSPSSHRCSRCGREHRGERYDRFQARLQHLWVAERAAHLATIGILGENDAAVQRASGIVAGYGARYLEYPNQDNVLGPSRLFFSTYLESVWICSYLAAASLLREGGALDHETAGAVSQVADEAANLIGEFNEGLSNRQTWHNAALIAIAAWFEDEELARRALEGTTGLLAHLVDGFGADGMWYEGENYHLFALRGLLTGAEWARQAGADLFEDPNLAGRIDAALRAPTISALPDLTYPARKDSRFGVSLAQPMYLELWEIGNGRMGGWADESPQGWLASWLQALYRTPAPEALVFESYLHEAGEPRPAARSRTELSWWALLGMSAEPLPQAGSWSPGSELLPSQGLAVLRQGDRYVSLECGEYGGGHGHPDRLHLTLHAGGVHWLPDPGTGSYVSRDLFWYRSTLAHNAPRLDGLSQPIGDAGCEMFDVQGDWGWARGRYRELLRTVVSTPEYVLDIVECSAEHERLMELPWHLAGTVEAETPGRWEAAELTEEFTDRVESFVPEREGPLRLRADAGQSALELWLLFDGALLRASGPGLPAATGLPSETGRARFLTTRTAARYHRIIAVLDPSGAEPMVTGLRVDGGLIEVTTRSGIHRHRASTEGWSVDHGTSQIHLAGPRPTVPVWAPILDLDLNRRDPPVVVAPWVSDPPARDGILDDFDWSQAIAIEVEDQYRRSEEPYPGPDSLSAQAALSWNEHGLHLGVEVVKEGLCFRSSDATPLRLDNERDEIHSDGLQVYLRHDGVVYGFLVVPDPTTDRIRGFPVEGTAGAVTMITGRWRPTERGYGVTLTLSVPGWEAVHRGNRFGFDLLINEMRPGRVRRAGQLVWSGGNGWVYLRGDRQDPSRFGVLELR